MVPSMVKGTTWRIIIASYLTDSDSKEFCYINRNLYKTIPKLEFVRLTFRIESVHLGKYISFKIATS